MMMIHCRMSRIMLLVLLLLISKTAVKAQGAALGDRWSLPEEGPLTFEYLQDETDGGLDFLLRFPISKDVATVDGINVSLYDQNCRYNDGDPRVELFKGIAKEVAFRGKSAIVMAELDVKLGNHEINLASLLLEYPTLWNEEESQISFCVRFSLMTEDIEVNFVETVVILDVSLVGVGFRIDNADVKPKEKIVSSNRVSYEVKAYLCGGNYKPLEEETTGLVKKLYEVCDAENGIQTFSEIIETKNTTTVGEEYQQDLSDAQKAEKERIIYPQGSVLRVCIRPDDTIFGEMSMRTIESLVFKGTYSDEISPQISAMPPLTTKSDGIYTQYAVQDGSTEISQGLSAISCETNRLEGNEDVVVCAVDTVLIAAFYWRSPGVVATVTAYGIASLQFGGVDMNYTNEERNLTTTVADDQQSPENHHPENQEQRKTEVDLDMHWSMIRPEVDFSRMDETGGFDFDMEYTFSDAISNDMLQVEIWTKDCEQSNQEPILTYPPTASESSSDLLEVSSTKAYETGSGDGTQTIILSNRWKREQPGFSRTLMDSNFYAENSDGTLVQISLCVRYQLHTKKSSGGIEVNFLETPVIINIDLKAGMSFGFTVGLVPEDDKCIEELQKMSGGGLDSLFWSPSTNSADPSMPLGPPVSGSYSSRYGSSTSSMSNSNTWFPNTQYQPRNDFFPQSSPVTGSPADKHIGLWTVAIGSVVCLGFSLI